MASGNEMPRQTRSRTKRKTTIKAMAGATTFNSLPTEIRLMIWEEFVRTPRVIRVDLYNLDVKPNRGFSCYFGPGRAHAKSEQVSTVKSIILYVSVFPDHRYKLRGFIPIELLPAPDSLTIVDRTSQLLTPYS